MKILAKALAGIAPMHFYGNTAYLGNPYQAQVSD
jgi:hypothetical protein